MSVKVTNMKGKQNNNNNSYFLTYKTMNSKETSNSHISGSSRPKIGDQIQGLDVSYLRNIIGPVTLLTLVLA